MQSFFKKYFKSLYNVRDSIIGKIVSFFIIMFVLMLTPTVILTYTSFRQSKMYAEMIGNIAYANILSTDVNTKIEPVVWDIVAGKVTFEGSSILPLIADIRSKMEYMMANTDSIENIGIIEISLRALSTLEDYVDKLGEQIRKRSPVEENENVLEEIRVCVSLINDLLMEFSSKQLVDVASLNEEMAQRSNVYLIINVGLLIVVLSAGVYAFWYIFKSIMNPIEKLLDMSKRISDGDFSSRVSLTASKEFKELATGMNTMSEHIELLIEKSVEEQKQLQRLEARALQAQITPHFLYNTLDAIIWAAEGKNTADVIKLVTSLSSFFRISLSHGIDFITISNEIEHIRSYLIIQQIRYSDILTYEIYIDRGIENRLILKLLLQPLVENALYHGIKNTRERGKIIIRVIKQDRGVLFSVADNGIGLTEAELNMLKRRLDDDSNQSSGYGLFNVNRRLKLYYDKSEGVEIKSEYKKGTEISFVLDI